MGSVLNTDGILNALANGWYAGTRLLTRCGPLLAGLEPRRVHLKLGEPHDLLRGLSTAQLVLNPLVVAQHMHLAPLRLGITVRTQRSGTAGAGGSQQQRLECGPARCMERNKGQGRPLTAAFHLQDAAWEAGCSLFSGSRESLQRCCGMGPREGAPLPFLHPMPS